MDADVEIQAYNDALAVLKTAEKALNAKVDLALQSCETEADYMEIVRLLPNRYPGTRRIYEAILRKFPEGQ